MSNGFEETEIESPDDFDSDIPFEEENTLGNVWKNNPLVKMGIILAAFVAVVGSIILFGGSEEKAGFSHMGAGSEIKQTPGTEELTPVMRNALEENNQQMAEEAMRTNSSTIPVPIDPSRERLTVSKDEPPEDPLERWRLMQKERLQAQREMEQYGQIGTQECKEAQNVPAIEELAGLGAEQLQQILEAKKQFGLGYRMITKDKDFNEIMDGRRKQEVRLYSEAIKAATPEAVEPAATILIPAGEIEYAQLLTEANTDAPGPVLAQIVTGPLAGSRVLGEFEATDEYLVLSFNTIIKDGKSLSCNAFALDPDTTLPGIVSEIDRRYFRRIVLPAAAKFIEGMGSAIAESGSTTVSVINGGSQTQENDLDTRQELYKGVEEAASLAAEVLTDEGDSVKPLIRVTVGTPVGLLFLGPVMDNNEPVTLSRTRDERGRRAESPSSQAEQLINLQQQLMSLQQQMAVK